MKKDSILAIMMIILICLIFSLRLNAQTGYIEDQCKTIVGNATLVKLPIADKTANNLLDIFTYSGEKTFDLALSLIDSTWYKSVDVYIGQSQTSVVNTIINDTNAEFKEMVSKDVVLSVVENDQFYLVMIFSL